jgi:hypothetical protein
MSINDKRIIKKLRADLALAKDALAKADEVIGYASMTAWEREACADDMNFITSTLNYLVDGTPLTYSEMDRKRKEEALSARAREVLGRIRAGRWYFPYERRTPKACAELETAGLIIALCRVESIRLAYVPTEGYVPFTPERFATRPEKARKPGSRKARAKKAGKGA